MLRGIKTPGSPHASVIAADKVRRSVSNDVGGLPGSRTASASFHNLRNWSTRSDGALPQMIAPFTAPTDAPATQLGSRSCCCNAS
jgi:hypothetical protein